ncbi:DUF2306 domain-containing protein [Stieleria sp. JC731]|uniref:DUF2306 domain-containing protein n=1 Tax=Pirellulaceae TaxID=2691357 RepID=UPI001E4241D1|nr:DUF2306 domain-containing protein [Stieleria sp. JC731]MCC9600652.1 DUF2306 domain-containing protein [Stieleria sp. JC731]
MLVFASFRFRTLWTLIFLVGSAAIVVSLLAYFRVDRTATFLLEKGDLRHQPLWRTSFYIHVATSTVCLLTGPLLMFRRAIRWKTFHRWLGYVHLNAILWFAAPTGLILSLNPKGGLPSAIGFAVTAGLWWFATWRGYRTIQAGNVSEHARWMIRSYSLTLGAVWFRLIFVAMGLVLPAVSSSIDYIASVWLSLLASVWVAESSIRVAFPVKRKSTSREGSFAQAAPPLSTLPVPSVSTLKALK